MLLLVNLIWCISDLQFTRKSRNHLLHFGSNCGAASECCRFFFRKMCSIGAPQPLLCI